MATHARTHILEVRKKLVPKLTLLASQIDEIEEAVEKKYRLGAVREYRLAKYDFASSAEARDNLRLYWKEVTKENLSEDPEHPVEKAGRMMGSRAGYRSSYLDSLYENKIRSSGNIGSLAPHFEPTLAASDENSGENRQSGYDHIRAAWQRRAQEAKDFPVVFADDQMSRDSLSHTLRKALPYFGKQFEFATYTNCSSHLTVIRYPERLMGCELLLSKSNLRDFDMGQIDFQIIFAPKSVRIQSSPRLFPHELGYVAIGLSAFFPGYLHGYGTFRNAREFELCIFAGVVFAREIFDRLVEAG